MNRIVHFDPMGWHQYTVVELRDAPTHPMIRVSRNGTLLLSQECSPPRVSAVGQNVVFAQRHQLQVDPVHRRLIVVSGSETVLR